MTNHGEMQVNCFCAACPILVHFLLCLLSERLASLLGNLYRGPIDPSVGT